MKTCLKCGSRKSLDQFAARGRFDWCFLCRKAHRLFVRYGMTPEDYDEKVRQQEGRCLICGLNGGKKPLMIDHDHATGRVRGLLCSKCNLGLGHFMDDPARLLSAIEYLKTGCDV